MTEDMLFGPGTAAGIPGAGTRFAEVQCCLRYTRTLL